jgi:hypothetical protein
MKRKVFGPGRIEVDFRIIQMCGINRVYISGFKRAADIVVDGKPKGGHADDLLFAIGYLYRHAIELQLKYIIYLGLDLGLLRKRPDCLDDHALYPLWNQARKILSENWEKELLQPLEPLIQELHNVDPSGQEFRYERRKDKKRSLQNLPTRVSLATMKRAIGIVYDSLDKCLDGLEGMWDASCGATDY